ncbi:MAG TPA: PQQ-binding-like beta-propeller repeat protein, partial [Ktedonobacteraceae bacterium]|nr:PQQ-binding-like beta-propeller repeat protein [Ktedonobacteraceae bacterium]
TAVKPQSAPPYEAMFGFDAQHTHYNSYEHTLNPTNVSRLVLDWTTTAKPLPSSGLSSPTVANGVVYATSNDGKLYALNATTGAVLWSVTPNSGVDTRLFVGTPLNTPAVANGVVYVDLGGFKVFAYHLPG